ncbi:MAG: DUF3798 domain-containing protein, partial [Fusobacteriaceae bacterium]
ISQISALANDPKMKAIIIGEGLPGTLEGIRKVREKRPDILLIVDIPHEDPAMVAKVADLSMDRDTVNRGFLIVQSAKNLGAKTFVHLSFPRHMSYELLSRRRNVMKAAANDLGLKFEDVTVPDPTSDVGVAGAQQYILEQMPTWVKKYGKDTAFYATNDAQTEPLIKKIAELGAIFIEPDAPSPTMGYPGAFGIEFTAAEKGNWPKILAKVESVVKKTKGKGRMGTWAYSYNFSSVIGLFYRAQEVIEKGGSIKDEKALMAALTKSTPGSAWNGSVYADPKGVELSNFFMVYQDTYIFGKGYLGNTKVKVPAKYSKVK